MKKAFSRVFVKDTQGDILILRDRVGVWNFPGGKKEPGEKPADCAVREVEEEVGIEVSELEEIYHGDLVFNDMTWDSTFYFAYAAKGKPTLNEVGKIKGVQFVDDLHTIPFSSGLNPVFNYLEQSNILEKKQTKWMG